MLLVDSIQIFNICLLRKECLINQFANQFIDILFQMSGKKFKVLTAPERRRDLYFVYAIGQKPSAILSLKVDHEGTDHLISKLEAGSFFTARNIQSGCSEYGEYVKMSAKTQVI